MLSDDPYRECVTELSGQTHQLQLMDTSSWCLWLPLATSLLQEARMS